MIVVDAAGLVDYLLAREPGGLWVAERLAQAKRIHAPQLVDFEVASALRRLARRGELSPERGQGALEDLRHLPLRRYPAARLLDSMWGLRDRLTAYDAAYVALAELLAVPLVTTDRRLAATTGHAAEILVPA